MALLSVLGLSKLYADGSQTLEAIRDVTVNVEDGEFLSIVGPSGCGKSTFLHIIGGFVQPSEGSMRLAGRLISGPGPDRGMMFQDFALFPWKSVEGNIAWGLEAQGVSVDKRKVIVDRYLDMVGLTRFRHSYPHQLSGGMKQRVALARVLAFDPEVLLMDEPFGSLDAQTRELMQEELNAVWEQTRKTVLFVTHDIEEAIYLSDRILVFTARPGRIKREIRVDLPRPRSLDVKKTEQFLHVRNAVWDELRQEVLRAYRE